MFPKLLNLIKNNTYILLLIESELIIINVGYFPHKFLYIKSSSRGYSFYDYLILKLIFYEAFHYLYFFNTCILIGENLAVHRNEKATGQIIMYLNVIKKEYFLFFIKM